MPSQTHLPPCPRRDAERDDAARRGPSVRGTRPADAVERLLLVADQYTRHNDMLDLLLRTGSGPEPDAHVASAQRLASATRTALQAVTNERLFESPELSDAVVCLQQPRS